MPKKIKKQNEKPNKIIGLVENNPELDYPVFCFRYLQTTPQKDYKFYANFIERLKKLSNMSWNEINTSQRHGFGTEKMPVSQIKSLPKFISPDVSYLTVFRAAGDNRTFLGLRVKSVFHIIFIEEKFNDIYNH